MRKRHRKNRNIPLYLFVGLSLLMVLVSSCPGKTSGQDKSVINWTAAHAADTDFIPQARLLIDSVAERSPEELEEFVRNIADALCGQGKGMLAASIAAYPHGINLPGNEYSEIGQRLLTQLVLPGNAAPQLPIPDKDRLAAKGMLVLFFESDCHSCHHLINELTAAYDSLRLEGVRIVSIASDIEPGRYEACAAKLPWKDKFCDYESFSGKYFKRWGVAYTPTLYYVDREGIVKGKYSSLRNLTP